MITYQTPVLEEWVDYNGHLRDAFYLLIFSYATDAFMSLAGIDPLRDQRSLFTLECHLNYLREVKAGTPVQVHTRVIAHDSKRLQLYHSLKAAGQDNMLAANEQMLLHVDLQGPHATPFSESTVQCLEHWLEGTRHLPLPAHSGRAISLHQKH